VIAPELVELDLFEPGDQHQETRATFPVGVERRLRVDRRKLCAQLVQKLQTPELAALGVCQLRAKCHAPGASGPARIIGAANY
jgi:hypothetical protein